METLFVERAKGGLVASKRARTLWAIGGIPAAFDQFLKIRLQKDDTRAAFPKSGCVQAG